MADERTFDQWVEAFNPRFAALYAYIKSGIPDDIGLKTQDVEKSIQLEDECSRLRSDCELHLTHETAKATLARITANPELTASDRKTMIKDDVRFIERQLQALLITESSIRSRRISILSGNKRTF